MENYIFQGFSQVQGVGSAVSSPAGIELEGDSQGQCWGWGCLPSFSKDNHMINILSGKTVLRLNQNISVSFLLTKVRIMRIQFSLHCKPEATSLVLDSDASTHKRKTPSIQELLPSRKTKLLITFSGCTVWWWLQCFLDGQTAVSLKKQLRPFP